MSFIDKLERAREILERHGRLSARALERELEIGGDELDELIEELVDIQQLARREGKALVWAGGPALRPSEIRSEPETRTAAPTPRRDEPAEARKVVSIIFADLIGSTSLHERLDAESARRLMERYYAALRAAVESHGGTVVKLLGDGVMAAFGLRQVAEDDALRAVHAAVAMQDAFRALVQEQGVLGAAGLRVAVNTGEVVVGADDDVIGDPVNIAARLQEQGRDGEVVVGETTRRLVATRVTLAPLGSVTLKGRAEAVAAYRVVSFESAAVATAPFVGREEELTRLGTVYETAVATPAARLVVLLGSPGLGKSRLIEELARRHADTATVILAHCDADAGATFAPLAEALRGLLGIDDAAKLDTLRAAVESALPAGDADRGRIAGGIAALLAGSPASPEEAFFVVRRFLAGLAATKPVVLVIDDMHWAEPLLLDLVEHLVQWGGGVPLLVLIGARPELRDLRSSLVTSGPLVADVVTLAGLDAGAAMRLAANVIGATDLPAAVAAKVLATSEGNPLFVGELVRMLVQEGALTKEGDRWVPGVALASLEMPPTIHALLAARIERLRPEERSVLERAAVVGRHFSRSAVAQLLPRDIADLDVRLESLQRSELIERDSGWFLGEPVLRFHHVLIRDAAYRRLLKGTRAELHARFADWVAGRAGEAAEHDEIIGWHLEQAHQLLGELGPISAQGRTLGERASRHLAAAGRRALARDDLPVAAGLLGRALDRLDATDPARADLTLDWCEALLAAGDVGTAAKAIDELGRFIDEGAVDQVPAPSPTHLLSVGEGGGEGTSGDGASGAPAPSSLTLPSPALNKRAGEASGRLRAWHTCFVGQLTALTAPQSLHATADAVAAAAAELAALGDTAGEAKAHFVHAQAFARLGKIGACEAALDRALAAARRAGDRRRANTVLAVAPLAALWGPSPVTRASGRCLDVVRVLRITQGAPAVEAVALSCQGVLEALRGRTDAARRMIASARKMVEELGITQRLLEVDVFAGRIELLEGDAAAAERCLRGAYEGLRDLGLGVDAAQAAALLARALLAQDRVAEAEALSHESEALAGDGLQASIAWRGIRAEALARRGEHATAVELAKAGVEIAATTDALLDHADARRALATALRAAGQNAEADAQERRATELWETKGATLLAERARQDRRTATSLPADAPILPPLRPATAADGTHRRVSANTATATIAIVDAAFARRDLDAVAALASLAYEEVEHWTGATWDREAWLTSCRRLMRSRNLEFRNLPLATLGESLMLSHRWLSAAAAAGTRFDVGAYESEAICFLETDENGLVLREEIFAMDRLGDAIAHLYNRYAELRPEGAERERAAATSRSVATMLGPYDPDQLAPALAATIEVVDHRTLGTWSAHGAEAFLQHFRAMIELADKPAMREDEILSLQSDALLLRRTHCGADRAGGGAYERPFIDLLVFGADGLLTRLECFDAGRDDEALARLDELVPCNDDRLTAEPAKASRVTRRVRPNAASAATARFEAAFAARDIDGIAALYGDACEYVEHATGTMYGREGSLDSVRWMFRSRDPKARLEQLATLGESLGLSRHRFVSGGNAGHRFDVGEYEREEIAFTEVDERGQFRRVQTFAPNHLGDAVARLYARYAEILLDGAERQRAAETASSVAVIAGKFDIDRLATAIAPDIQVVDNRNVGLGAMSGAEPLLRAVRALLDLSEGFDWGVDDVFGLRPDVLVVRHTSSGTDRRSGGAFERSLCELFVFGADGRIARWERFDLERVDEALARFDQLREGEAPAEPSDAPSSSAGASPSHVRRRVRPNEVTAFWSRFDAVFAAGDADAIDASFSDSFAEIDHTTGASYGRDGALTSIRRLLRSPDPGFRHEALATLGPSLGLVRGLISASGTGGRRFDVGAYEIEEIKVTEVDEQRRLRSAEVFARERLGDAIARLYERYAELLPDGPTRERATARARSIAAMASQPDPVRRAAVFAPDIEMVDHRMLGTWVAHGAEAVLRHFESVHQVADTSSLSDHDILALEPDALLVLRMHVGAGKLGGGAYERRFLMLLAAGTGGHLARIEWFDAERGDEALARFEELVGSSSQPKPNPLAPFPAREGGSGSLPSLPASGRDRGRGSSTSFANAATRFCERFVRAWAARDWDAVTALHSAAHHNDDRRRLMQMRVAAEANLTQLRTLFDVPRSRMAMTPVATRGERLALTRILYEGDSDGGGGTLAIDYLGIIESDGDGRLIEIVLFDLDDIDAAYAELDARYDAGDGAAHVAHGAFLRAYARAIASRDWDPVVALCVPTLVEYDHRALAVLGTTRGVEAWVQNFRTLTDLTADTVYRIDHFRSAAHGFWSVGTWHGSREGGDYDIPINAVLEMDDQDRLARSDIYDPEQVDQARARFEELTDQARHARNLLAGIQEGRMDSCLKAAGMTEGRSSLSPLGKGRTKEGSQSTRFANAATRAVDRGTAALAARDWEGFTALFAADFRHYDRTRIAQLETDGREWLASFRRMVEMTTGRPTQQVLATRGERLALFRVVWRGAEGDIGPSEIDWVLIIEVDGHGDHVAVVAFDPDDLDTAYAELDARWEAGEAALHPHAFAWVREFQRAFAARDWQAMAALHAPDQVAVNHRTVGWGTLHGPGGWVPTLQALVELAPDTRFRLDHLRTCERGILWQSAWQGTRDGGPFETPQLVAAELDDHGRQIRMDVWDADVFEPARARFAEMTTAPVARPQRFANAATATTDPVIARLVAHDWQGFAQLFAEDFHISDRRHVVQLELDRGQYVAFTREVSDGRTIRGHSEVIATRGDLLALNRSAYEFTDADVGPSEIAFLILTEVDDRGRIIAYVRWDLEDLDAAYAELEARWQAGEAAAHPLAPKWIANYGQFFVARDWNAMAAIMAPDLVSHSHRLVSWGTLHGPAGLVSTMQAQMELAPDTQVRVDHVRSCAGGLLLEYAWHGTRDGGAFENLLIAAVEIDALGRGRRVDVWEAEQLEQARARFGEIAQATGPDDANAAVYAPSVDRPYIVGSPPYQGGVRGGFAGQLLEQPPPRPLVGKEEGRARPTAPDPLRIPPNASTRANDRWWACVEAGDWDALRPLIEPIVFEDRRRLIRIAGGADLLLADSRHIWEPGLRPTRTLLATAGDRLSLERMLWSVSDEGQRSEIDVLKVCEVDREGRIVAYLIFDADDRAAASAELVERYARSGADEMPAAWFEFVRAWNDHDLDRLRRVLPSDYFFHDHRHTGIGRVDGEAYIASLAALFELSPDVRLEPLYWFAGAAHGRVGVMRWVGTNAEGGEFEAVFAGISLCRGERPVGAELFEIDDLEAALARFAELQPDPPSAGLRRTGPLRIPPNAATRVRARAGRAYVARDWDAARRLVSADFIHEDRGRRALLSGGVEMWIGSLQFTSQPGFLADSTLLGTLGNRIALDRVVWFGKPGGDAFEFERIRLLEVDADGRLRAVIFFDPDDRRAAFDEAQARFVAGEAAGIGWETIIAGLRACSQHDWSAMRAQLASGFVYQDQRRISLGTYGPDELIESLREFATLAADVQIEMIRILVWNRHGGVAIHRVVGRSPGGGPFEQVFATVALLVGDRVQRLEDFDIEDAERAVARFGELCIQLPPEGDR